MTRNPAVIWCMILKSIKDQTDCEHIESIVNFIDRVKSIPSAEMNNRTNQNQIQATSNAQLLQQELINEQAAVVPYQASYLHPISAPGTPAPIYYSSPYSNPPMTSLGVTPMTSQITPSSTGLMMPMIPSTVPSKQPSMSTNSVSLNSIPVTSSSSICVPSTSTSLQTTNPKSISSSTNPFSSNWKANYVTITDASQEKVLDPNAFSKLETQAFDWFKKDEKAEKTSKPSKTPSPPKNLELETEKSPVSYLSKQMKNSKLENLDPWVTFESPTKSSPPSTFPPTAKTNNLTTTNPTLSDTKLNPQSNQISKPPLASTKLAPPPTATVTAEPLTTVTAMPVSKPMTTMTPSNVAPRNVSIASVSNPVITSPKKSEMVKTQTVSTPAPMQIYTTIESNNSRLTQNSMPHQKIPVSKAPVISAAPPNRSPNSMVQPSKIQTQNYGVYGHIPSTTPQKSPKQPNIALMASDDAVNLLRQKYGLAPTKKASETPSPNSRPLPKNSVNSNGIEKDIFARKPARSSLTDQKMVDAKSQILVNQFSNTITKEQASFVLSENNMDVKKAIKSIKVHSTLILTHLYCHF